MITNNGKKLLLSGFSLQQDNKKIAQIKCTDGEFHDLLFKNTYGGNNRIGGYISQKHYQWLDYSESAISVTASSSKSLYLLSTESNNMSYNNTWLGIFVGSGTTPPSADDYQMENAINKNLMEPKNLYLDCTFPNAQLSVTFQNVSENDITISELCLYGTCSLATINNNAYCPPTSVIPFIIGRQILENPVTVKPNELVTFGYKFSV